MTIGNQPAATDVNHLTLKNNLVALIENLVNSTKGTSQIGYS